MPKVSAVRNVVRISTSSGCQLGEWWFSVVEFTGVKASESIQSWSSLQRVDLLGEA